LGPSNTAYLIYTSGSTGLPKGVPVPHAPIAEYFVWFGDEYRVDETDRLLQVASPSFDVSIGEIFGTLICGARLVIPRPDGLRDIGYLTELLRREVMTVSADPLSPERGSYQFAQEMLRQVAYDTLSRRDRKTRHLKVAAHLRASFAGDGEEMADVIARHYLDALNALPDDPDAAGIRALAATALVRAGERAERTGAPSRAATSYATAAQLVEAEDADDRLAAGALWERAARTAQAAGDYAVAAEHAGLAREYYLQRGQHRAATAASARSSRPVWGDRGARASSGRRRRSVRPARSSRRGRRR